MDILTKLNKIVGESTINEAVNGVKQFKPWTDIIKDYFKSYKRVIKDFVKEKLITKPNTANAVFKACDQATDEHIKIEKLLPIPCTYCIEIKNGSDLALVIKNLSDKENEELLAKLRQTNVDTLIYKGNVRVNASIYAGDVPIPKGAYPSRARPPFHVRLSNEFGLTKSYKPGETDYQAS